MCGIAGVYALGERAPDPAWAIALARCLGHRGPDDHGTWCDARVALAHTRLAIIDVSAAGHQPMLSGDGRHVLVMNGEIYNHAALRAEMAQDGVAFRSHSDTEVLVERFARQGMRALEGARGMFACAFYDRATGDLTLVRDRLGKKPIVWVRTDEWLAFASEARALLALPFVRARLDRAALADYLRLLYVPAPRTLLEGVHKLPAGHALELSGADRAAPPAPRRWWRLPEADPAQRADARWLARLDAGLLEATRLRTVSDVPIGVFLSGGIDSNVVLERLHAAGHRPLRTFTVGFEGLADERPLARLGADRFSDEHVELVIRADVARDVPAVLDAFGDPLGDSAVVTTALIAREAGKHVKVIVNGDGGDELFGGYPRYRFARRVELAQAVPGGFAALMAHYGNDRHKRAALEALRRDGPVAAAHSLGSVLDPRALAGLLAPEFADACAPRAGDLLARTVAPAGHERSLTAAIFAWDAGVYLPDDLLVKVDVASMLHGIENRSPLLDHALFEHVAALSPARRTHPLATKPLLRRLARGRIPAPLLRAPKRGFQLPLASWLDGPLSGWLDGLLGDPHATRALWREGALEAELERFHARRADSNAPLRLWGIAVLEHWARRFAVSLA
ncbi:MAG TPA: asparagine synthase (glutamine-hydrolyzing) [Candidatus Eisenbacteria bacterium]|nr:asparagine synthase (glutamine-hydrolyzing) [Candidatus Eisenbacteria bacterium]